MLLSSTSLCVKCVFVVGRQTFSGGMSGLYGHCIFNIFRNFSKVDEPLDILVSTGWESHLLHMLGTRLYWQTFNLKHSNMYVVVCPCGFILHFPGN